MPSDPDDEIGRPRSQKKYPIPIFSKKKVFLLKQMLLLLLVIACCMLLDTATAFTKPVCRSNGAHSVLHHGKNRTSSSAAAASTSSLKATINFYGEASASIKTPFPSDATSPDKTLPNWMLSPSESDFFFLGTNDYKPAKKEEGLWEAFQPSVDWFGLELVPVFRIRLDRCEVKRQVSATIQEARSDIRSGAESVTGNVIKRVMEKSTFQGGNTVAWRDDFSNDNNEEGGGGWILQADLCLTVSIPLPSFLPLPPGFNAIGSRIVKSTCRKRLKQNLVDLQEAYLAWARQEVEEMSSTTRSS